MVRDEHITFCAGGQCRFFFLFFLTFSTVWKILCFTRSRSRFFLFPPFSPSNSCDFQIQKGIQKQTLSVALESLPYWFRMSLHAYNTRGRWHHLTCKSCNAGEVVHRQRPFPVQWVQKLWDNQLPIYSIFSEDVWWSLNDTIVCSPIAEWSTRSVLLIVQLKEKYSQHLSCVTTAWGSLCPSLLVTMGKIDFATALIQTAVFISFLCSSSRLLESHERVLRPTPQKSKQTKKESIRSAVSGGLTMIQNHNDETSVNSPASYKDKNRKNLPPGRFSLFSLF